MSLFDLLPEELLHVIARDSEPAYKALLAYPRFARAVSPGTRIDYMIDFGHSVILRDYGTFWYRNGKKHKLDGPAEIHRNKHIHWYCDGLFHRIDGPAIICEDGSIGYYNRGNKHRIDGPAIIYMNGREKWYKNGKLHRDDGPAIRDQHGKEYWYRNGCPIRRRWNRKGCGFTYRYYSY